MSDNKAAGGCLTLILALVLVSQVCSFISHPVHHWKDATCTEPQTCVDCGKTKGEPLGHVLTEATCTAPPVCLVCGETVGTTAPHEWLPPTCTKGKVCAVCGKEKSWSFPLGHEWVEATCYAPKTCSVCGETEGSPVHSYESWTTVVEPTCQSEGEKQSVCVLCGHVGCEPIPKLDHLSGGWQTVQEATPTSPGLKARFCTVCGEQIDSMEVAYTPPTSDSSDSGSGSGSNFNLYDNEQQQKTSASYVLNTSTRVFHRPSCRDVKRIAPQNYATSSESRDSIIARGYRSCGHCSP